MSAKPLLDARNQVHFGKTKVVIFIAYTLQKIGALALGTTRKSPTPPKIPASSSVLKLVLRQLRRSNKDFQNNTVYKTRYPSLGTMKTISNVMNFSFRFVYIVNCVNLMMQIKNVLFFFISSRLSKGLANCLDRHFWSGLDAESVSVYMYLIRNAFKKFKKNLLKQQPGSLEVKFFLDLNNSTFPVKNRLIFIP